MNGFTLAGFQQVVVDEGGVLELFEKIVNASSSGLVFIDERLLQESIQSRLQVLEKQWGGALVSLPAPGKGDEAVEMDYGKRFISRVLGYQLKLS